MAGGCLQHPSEEVGSQADMSAASVGKRSLPEVADVASPTQPQSDPLQVVKLSGGALLPTHPHSHGSPDESLNSACLAMASQMVFLA
jgi:hypothetical protein